MDSGKVQKLIESHLRMIQQAPKNKRVEVFSHQVEYLIRLILEHGAISQKVLRSRLIASALEAGIEGKEASTIIENAQRWAKAEQEISQFAAPENPKSNRK